MGLDQSRDGGKIALVAGGHRGIGLAIGRLVPGASAACLLTVCARAADVEALAADGGYTTH